MWLDLPIRAGAYKNVDEDSLNAVGSVLENAYLDEFDNMVTFPGGIEYCDLGTGEPVDALFWWPVQSKGVAISGGKVFRLEDRNGNYTDVTGDAPEKLKRAMFADYGTALYFANGGKILKLTPTGTSAALTDVDTPTTVTHVATLDKYLICNETNTGLTWYSAVADPDSWEGEFFESESKPDFVTSMQVDGGLVHTFGRESTERWYNDGVSPFAHYSQGDVSRGWIAPYSILPIDGGFIGLDQDRQVVKLVGTQPQIISKAVNAYIQSFNTVSDARADHILISGRPFYVLSFPTEGKTLALDYSKQDPLGWFELTRYNPLTNNNEAWIGNCHAYSDLWNLNLVGDRRTGKIWKLSSTVTTYGTDITRTVRRSGFIDHGKHQKKKSNALRLRIKRKKAGGTLLVRWRDNGQENAWSTARELSLGSATEVEMIVTIRQLGLYYTRQWEFSNTDGVILMSAQEDVELLR